MKGLRNRNRDDADGERPPQWQTIYCSLMLLLVVFFVMIAVWSTVEACKIAYARNIAEAPQMDASDAAEKMRKYSELPELKGLIRLERLGGGFKAVVQSPVLFAPGKADLNPASYKMLREIAHVAVDSGMFVTIEGHTDNTPIHVVEFPSNWELSTMRAINVLRFLHKTGLSADRLSAVGYGEHRPVVDNQTDAGRQMNRRIEVIFSKEAQ